MKILGIETSCDETAVAVVEDGHYIHSNVVFSQADIHAAFGGIVPEVASRQHIITIVPSVQQALEKANINFSDLDGIGVTNGPGLAGSLITGINTAKGLALANNLPLIGINHLEGHIYASWLDGHNPESKPGFPLMCLIASGGHTDLIVMKNHGNFTLVGKTRDDAAGEAFDKAARILGLGFPGGPAIQKMSEKSNGGETSFPRPKIKNSLDFSFSGLKTAMLRRAQEKKLYPHDSNTKPDQKQIPNLSAAFQEAVVDSLVTRTIEAAKVYRTKGILLGGGVAANTLLRKEFSKRSPVEVIVPKPNLCTDNGAMIGAASWFHLRDTLTYEWDLDVLPKLRLG